MSVRVLPPRELGGCHAVSARQERDGRVADEPFGVRSVGGGQDLAAVVLDVGGVAIVAVDRQEVELYAPVCASR